MQNSVPMMRRLLTGIAAVVVAWCAALFAYGFVHFPATPYKPCGSDAYCDKLGRQHSKAEAEAFSRWNRMLLWSWPFGIVAIVAIQRMRSSSKQA
jgi:hypothetical protein